MPYEGLACEADAVTRSVGAALGELTTTSALLNAIGSTLGRDGWCPPTGHRQQAAMAELEQLCRVLAEARAQAQRCQDILVANCPVGPS